jgi:hypothetical protein
LHDQQFAIRTQSLSNQNRITYASFRHVTYSWDDAKAAALDPVGRLIYRSNILGCRSAHHQHRRR